MSPAHKRRILQCLNTLLLTPIQGACRKSRGRGEVTHIGGVTSIEKHVKCKGITDLGGGLKYPTGNPAISTGKTFNNLGGKLFEQVHQSRRLRV